FTWLLFLRITIFVENPLGDQQRVLQSRNVKVLLNGHNRLLSPNQSCGFKDKSSRLCISGDSDRSCSATAGALLDFHCLCLYSSYAVTVTTDDLSRTCIHCRICEHVWQVLEHPGQPEVQLILLPDFRDVPQLNAELLTNIGEAIGLVFGII